jgi:cytochrome c553
VSTRIPITLSLALLVALAGCRGEASPLAPVGGIRNMWNQPRYANQGRSAFFTDGRMLRPQPLGTVAREMETDARLETGREEDGTTYVLMIPEEIGGRFGGQEPMLRRGEERFNIYCAPCHGRTGDGKGIMVARGLLAPPSYHQDRLRHIPDGQLFTTITNGIRNMPGYYAQIPTDDRWAIVAYVRALQLSQANVPVEAP